MKKKEEEEEEEDKEEEDKEEEEAQEFAFAACCCYNVILFTCVRATPLAWILHFGIFTYLIQLLFIFIAI